ncbi:MAG: DUF4492 domain-containing protein [Bacteroides sp.]|nr:DUF4492 domain-containing protein [Bacteroides sp.]
MITQLRGASAIISENARKVWSFYYDGFRNMTIGKTLWVIILVKLFLFFVVIKLLFFPNILQKNFDNDEDRADFVRKELINRN